MAAKPSLKVNRISAADGVATVLFETAFQFSNPELAAAFATYLSEFLDLGGGGGTGGGLEGDGTESPEFANVQVNGNLTFGGGLYFFGPAYPSGVKVVGEPIGNWSDPTSMGISAGRNFEGINAEGNVPTFDDPPTPTQMNQLHDFLVYLLRSHAALVIDMRSHGLIR